MCINCVKEGLDVKLAHDGPLGRAKAKAKSLKDQIRTCEKMNEGRAGAWDQDYVDWLKEELRALSQVI